LDSLDKYDVVILDSIGMLSNVYRYATIAYVGGGFNKHIHNVLEPAVFGVPVIFGTNFSKSVEATELIKEGGAFSISAIKSLEVLLYKLANDNELLQKTSLISRQHVQNRIGGTLKVLSRVKELIN
jgi:3-deoxy-D-manno-octulosonic-acid transferase